MIEIPRHVEALRRDGELLAAAAERAGADAAVPSCPEWVVRDLVRHTGGVHRWATGYVRDLRTEVWDVDLEDVVGGWPVDASLPDWLRAGCLALASDLDAADPGLHCWTFLPAPSPLAMWARRQAHETAIHRVDAELAAGDSPTPFPPDFAADGLDELLTCFLPRRSSRLRSEVPCTLRIATDDAPGEWLLRIGPDPVVATTGEAGATGEADCRVSGRASDLYLALWNRSGPGRLAVAGDADVLALFLDRVHVRWS